MDGAAIAVEEIGFGKRESAGTERTQRHALACEAPERVLYAGVHDVPDVHAATDEDDIERARISDATGGREAQAVTGGRRAALERQDTPSIDIAARDIVRHPAALERIRERDH